MVCFVLILWTKLRRWGLTSFDQGLVSSKVVRRFFFKAILLYYHMFISISTDFLKTYCSLQIECSLSCVDEKGNMPPKCRIYQIQIFSLNIMSERPFTSFKNCFISPFKAYTSTPYFRGIHIFTVFTNFLLKTGDNCNCHMNIVTCTYEMNKVSEQSTF